MYTGEQMRLVLMSTGSLRWLRKQSKWNNSTKGISFRS